MPILQDMPLEVSAEEILTAQGVERVNPGLLKDTEEAIALAQTLWEPMALYDWFDVCAVEGEFLTISACDGNGTEAVLHIGPKADLLAPAERALLSVVTIGPALEQQVRELHSSRESLKSYLLDSAGVVALGSVGETIRCVAEEVASREGWGVSPSLSPGSLVGWPLRGQRELCALLPLERIGVELNAHCVLVPHKSASGIIGLGPGYSSTKVGSVCKFCALKDTCWRRREDFS